MTADIDNSIYWRAQLTPKAIERFWAKVDRTAGPDACWPWTASTKGGGYGQVSVCSVGPDGQVRHLNRFSHRVAYAIAYGHLDDNLHVCHACDNPPCVNPTHLWQGDNSDNRLDSAQKGRHHNVRKTHCPAGHPYSGPNLMMSMRGTRLCRACDNARRTKR